jgi:hypothetical protein
VESKKDRIRRVQKYWEIIADNLKKAGENRSPRKTPEPWASGV